MTIAPDTTTFTFAWDPADIQAAVDNHLLFLQGGDLMPDQLEGLQQLPPKIRRAARTIAEISMPSATTVPEDVGDCSRLPAADAVVVQSSIENWPAYTVDEGIGVAYEHLTDLGQLYDLSSVFPEDQNIETQLIAHAVLHPLQAALVAKRLAQLVAAGEGDTPFAHGLAGLMTHHSLREVAAEVPMEDLIHWRRKLGLEPNDVARTSEIAPAHLHAIETGTAQPTRAETRRLTEGLRCKLLETAARA